jgi:hypothetical protein
MSAAAAPSASIGILGKMFKYSFYLSMVALLLFLLLAVLHVVGVPTFSFGVGDSGLFSVPTPQTQQIAFAKSPATPDLSCNFIDVYPMKYTISMDIYIAGEFLTTTAPRILLYRSNLRVTLPPTATEADLTTLFPTSNLLVYIDPLKNDLYISVLDEARVRHKSPPILNVPLREPFRLTVVLSDGFAEVYLAGELVTMMPLTKKPIASPPESYFFGPPSLVNQSIKVANIQYWNFELSSKAIRTLGATPVATTVFTSPS